MDRERQGTDREPKRAVYDASPTVGVASTSGPATHPFLRLHDSLGNRGVARRLQAKLAVSQPGDRLEVEADRAAEHAISGTAISPPCACQGNGPCPKCDSEQRKMVHRKATVDGGAPASLSSSPAPKGGRPLDAPVRSFMESRLGHDFGGVRIHTDAEASRSAWAIDALAYTVGPDIVFREGRYAPGTTEGRRLLAHELTHVVQQSRGLAPPGVYRDADREDFDTKQRRLIREAKDQWDVKAINPHALRLGSEVDRFRLMRILLDNTWVGPNDEYYISKIWSSFGKDLPDVAGRRMADRHGFWGNGRLYPASDAEISRFCSQHSW